VRLRVRRGTPDDQLLAQACLGGAAQCVGDVAAVGILGRRPTPYDLAPTLAELLGVTLPDAIGKSLLVR